MLLYQLKKLRREQVGDVGAKMPGRIRDDRIEMHFGVMAQPAAAVILDDPDFRIAKDRLHVRLLADEFEIAAIDLDDGQRLHRRIVGDHLGP